MANSGIFTEIEEVNLNSAKSAKVNENGEFTIEAEINDVLFFASKNALHQVDNSSSVARMATVGLPGPAVFHADCHRNDKLITCRNVRRPSQPLGQFVRQLFGLSCRLQ